MARYRILKPITYAEGGKAITILKPPAGAIELSDDAAAQLTEEQVQRVVEAEEPAAPPAETTGEQAAPVPTPETAEVPPVETADAAPEVESSQNTTPRDAAPGGRVKSGRGGNA